LDQRAMSEKRRIYVASSWRNDYQPGIVRLLRDAGHEVYDFRNPPGGTGFHWYQIDEGWEGWSVHTYREALKHPLALEGYRSDFEAMRWADTCVLVLPAGRSASWEFGWCSGAGKDCILYLPQMIEPELMYGGGGQTPIAVTEEELRAALAKEVTR
jgi:hypothetical protein